MLLLICIIFLLPQNGAATESIVNIPDMGPIKGLVHKTPDTGRDYYQYLGIPYGEAGRFELARPVEPWTELYDCTKEGLTCPQPLGEVQFLGGIGEDCLVLTVTTPVDPGKPITKLLPVMVFIYGGGYIIGTSRKEFYDPEFMVQEDIVVVQPNYRLGSFGWVTDGEVIPHNIALKDCRSALLWVRKYIQYFGGDPSLVTIAGESAGSAIVSSLWHAYERLPPNLFRNVIMESGHAIGAWAIQKDTRAAYLNVLTKTPCVVTINQTAQEQVDCLKGLHYQQLVIEDLITFGLHSGVASGVTHALNSAVVMEDPDDQDALMVKKPLEQLQTGDIATDKGLMITICNYEILTFAPLTEILRLRTNEHIVPEGMQPDDPNQVGGLIKSHYAGSEAAWATQTLLTYNEFVNDVFFYFPMRHFIDLVIPRLSPSARMYVLEFAYVSPIGRLNDKISRVGHADDLLYTWKWNFVTQENLIGITYPQTAKQKRAQFNKMLGNFVKFSNPTPGNDTILEGVLWPHVTDNNVNYLHFASDLSVRYRPQEKNIQFWRDLYAKYAKGTVTL